MRLLSTAILALLVIPNSLAMAGRGGGDGRRRSATYKRRERPATAIGDSLIPEVSLPAADPAVSLETNPTLDEPIHNDTLHRRVGCFGSKNGDSGDECTSAAKPPSPRPGFYADPATCFGERLAAVEAAIKGVGLLALAGKTAFRVTPPATSANPATFFFGDDRRAQASAQAQFVSAYNYANGFSRGKYLRIACVDLYGGCKDPKMDVFAYANSDGVDSIVLCDDYFVYSVLPTAPCEGGLSRNGMRGIGGTSQALLLLHEFMHAVSGNRVGDHAYGTKACGRLLADTNNRRLPADSDRLPSKNADSLARLAGWAYDIGLANTLPGAPYCPEQFRPDALGRAGEWPSATAWAWARFKHQMLCRWTGRKCYSAEQPATKVDRREVRAEGDDHPTAASDHNHNQSV